MNNIITTTGIFVIVPLAFIIFNFRRTGKNEFKNEQLAENFSYHSASGVKAAKAVK